MVVEMIYFLSPCAYTTSKWIGDEISIIPEISTILSTAVQMTACESHRDFTPAKEESNIFWWQWCVQSSYNLEWMIGLLECEMVKQNTLHHTQYRSHNMVNAVREFQHLFPRAEFTYPLNPDTERRRYSENLVGRKVYRKNVPPFWLKNHQVVIGISDSEPEVSP
jgi:hypothetical protein